MTLPLIGSVAALVLCTTELSATRSDSAEVRRVVETFVQGRERNAEDILRRSLSTDAQIVILQDSAAIDLDVDALFARRESGVATLARRQPLSIKSVEIIGTLASAALAAETTAGQVSERLTLLNIQGSWRIVNVTSAVSQHGEPLSSADQVAAVAATVNEFIEAARAGDADRLERTLHPLGFQRYVEDGKYSVRRYPEFLARFRQVRQGRPSPEDSRRTRAIQSVSVTGRVAMVKVVAEYPEAIYTDYVTVLRTGDTWRIVNTSFYGEAKPR
jgi:hypothetical protein